MCYIGFYGNQEIIIYLFQTGFPNGLFIAVSRHRVMTGVFAVYGCLTCKAAFSDGMISPGVACQLL